MSKIRNIVEYGPSWKKSKYIIVDIDTSHREHQYKLRLIEEQPDIWLPEYSFRVIEEN